MDRRIASWDQGLLEGEHHLEPSPGLRPVLECRESPSRSRIAARGPQGEEFGRVQAADNLQTSRYLTREQPEEQPATRIDHELSSRTILSLKPELIASRCEPQGSIKRARPSNGDAVGGIPAKAVVALKNPVVEAAEASIARADPPAFRPLQPAGTSRSLQLPDHLELGLGRSRS